MIIHIECKPDKVLLGVVAPLFKTEHDGNKEGVCIALKKSKNQIGMVDQDPFNPEFEYIRSLQLFKDIPESGLKLFHDEKRNNCIIEICPRLEEWTLKAAEDLGVRPDKFNLPADGNRLHKIVNVDLRKYEQFVKAMKGKGRLAVLERALNDIVTGAQ